MSVELRIIVETFREIQKMMEFLSEGYENNGNCNLEESLDHLRTA